jgi:hypothetical protein
MSLTSTGQRGERAAERCWEWRSIEPGPRVQTTVTGGMDGAAAEADLIEILQESRR